MNNIIIRFRLFDEGLGFRYEFPSQKNPLFNQEKNPILMAGIIPLLDSWRL
jgi:hypothetical protein